MRLRKLAEMAQRAGLMPGIAWRWDLTPDILDVVQISGKEFYAANVRKTPWGSQNCYWDEKSIDIQWNRNQAQQKQIEYRTGQFRKY